MIDNRSKKINTKSKRFFIQIHQKLKDWWHKLDPLMLEKARASKRVTPEATPPSQTPSIVWNKSPPSPDSPYADSPSTARLKLRRKKSQLPDSTVPRPSKSAPATPNFDRAQPNNPFDSRAATSFAASSRRPEQRLDLIPEDRMESSTTEGAPVDAVISGVTNRRGSNAPPLRSSGWHTRRATPDGHEPQDALRRRSLSVMEHGAIVRPASIVKDAENLPLDTLIDFIEPQGPQRPNLRIVVPAPSVATSRASLSPSMDHQASRRVPVAPPTRKRDRAQTVTAAPHSHDRSLFNNASNHEVSEKRPRPKRSGFLSSVFAARARSPTESPTSLSAGLAESTILGQPLEQLVMVSAEATSTGSGMSDEGQFRIPLVLKICLEYLSDPLSLSTVGIFRESCALSKRKKWLMELTNLSSARAWRERVARKSIISQCFFMFAN